MAAEARVDTAGVVSYTDAIKAGVPPIARRPRRNTWVVGSRNPTDEARLSTALDLPAPLAAVLLNRGLDNVEAARAFLNPPAGGIHDPFLLPDMSAAVERLNRALEAKEPILVHGDYDADGVTSAALMVRVLSKLGAEVSYFVPHRFHDHYGLSERAVRLSGKKGIGLVVAVDCGVSDYEAIAAARELGMDVIVVDHHEPGPTLPAEALVVNPKRADSVYPFTGLTAVGLAYKLSTALCQARGIKEDYLARAFLDLVAVGTIADVAPLVDENRGLCGTGLQLLPQTRKVGLRALLDACQLNGRVSASDVGFRVAPRLNAVGRMGDAHQALELLLTDDPDEALRLTLVLDGLNRQRQREQDRIYVEARQLAEEQLAERDVPVLVLSAPDWHLGVIGIVASKIVEDFGRPAVILAQEPEVCRGSGRSIEGFDMAAAFAACGELLQRSGGHALAGGLTLSPQYLPEVREKLCHLCAEALTRDQLETPLELDCEVRPEELTPELAQQVSRLEPCGQDNLAPLFLTRSLEVVSARPVGREGNHLKLTVAREAFAFDAIGFGMGNDTSWLRTRMKVDLAHVPEINAFNGTAGLQLHLTDLREAEGH